jgi:LmbE family N-acetylglucosaminyl deacetylase
MQKIIFGIFAHPDDEAFGPSGTLLLEARAGSQLHLVTLTAGENGMNPDNHQDLAAVRLQEWRQAGQLIGAISMHHLGYTDGQLNNADLLTIATTIEMLVRTTIGSKNKPCEIEFMTMDLNGISGHIDHIVAARAACLAFYRLKAEGWPVRRLRLACIPSSFLSKPNTDFVFMEAGRSPDEIDEIIDARSVAQEVKRIMRIHHTQREDGESHIARRGDEVAVNYFMIRQ